MVEQRGPAKPLSAATAVLVGVLVGLGAVAVPVGAATAIPTFASGLPGTANDAPAAAVGDDVYVFRTTDAGILVDHLDAQGAWGTGSSLRASIAGLPAVSLGGHVYLFARAPDGTGAQVIRFDPVPVAFTALGTLPFEPTAATTVDGSILLLGRCASSATGSACSGNATARYAPATGAFELLAAHAGPVVGAAIAGLEALIPEVDAVGAPTSTQLWSLDARGVTDRLGLALEHPVAGAAVVAAPCGLFAFGGRSASGATDLVQRIDSASKSAITLSWRLPDAGANPSAAVAAGVAYVFGLGPGGTTVAAAPLDLLCQVPAEPATAPGEADSDGDGVPDASDDCPSVANPQVDADGDGIGDACDELPLVPHAATPPATPGWDGSSAAIDPACPVRASDIDLDGLDDACDPDMDGDGVPDKGVPGAYLDLCPREPDSLQLDSDHDGAGDACDSSSVSVRSARNQARALPPVAATTPLAPTVALVAVAFTAGAGWLSRHRWGALLVLGFTRLRGDELVEQPVRRQILQLVAAQPGVHHQELRRKLGIGRGNLDHHVQVLLRSGHLREHRGSGYRCYFPPGTGAQAMRTSGVLKSELAQRLYEAVNLNPGSAVSELARRTEADYRAVAYHLERFEGAGVALLRHDGTTMRAYPSEVATGK